MENVPQLSIQKSQTEVLMKDTLNLFDSGIF